MTFAETIRDDAVLGIPMTGTALLTELDASLRSGSHDRSAETLRRVTDLFLNGERYSEQQLILFDDVFTRLVAKIETRALAELSDRLAAADNAPAGIIRRLASDNAIEVASPVLTQSKILTDDVRLGPCAFQSEDCE